jgi:hypothetical protein
MLRRRGGFFYLPPASAPRAPQFKAKAQEKFAHPPRVFCFSCLHLMPSAR